MPNNDTVAADIVETIESTPKKFPFALPKSKTAYAIYGAGTLLVVAGVAGAIFGRTQLSNGSADDAVAESNETSSN